MIIVTSSGERYKLRPGQNRVGRGNDCDFQLQGNDISRHHAMIKWEANQAHIMDLGSTNGTTVNGSSLEPYAYVNLYPGDHIVLGKGEEIEKLSVEAEDDGTEIAAASTVVMNLKDIQTAVQGQQNVTQELVSDAYAALASGDMNRIKEYWDEDVSWLIPGQNPLSGWHRGLPKFIEYLKKVGSLTGNSMKTQSISVLVGGDYSASVSKFSGYRAGYSESNAQKPDTKLDVEIIQLLRWQNGKIIEGRSSIFGEGASEYDRFWSFGS